MRLPQRGSGAVRYASAGVFWTGLVTAYRPNPQTSVQPPSERREKNARGWSVSREKYASRCPTRTNSEPRVISMMVPVWRKSWLDPVEYGQK